MLVSSDGGLQLLQEGDVTGVARPQTLLILPYTRPAVSPVSQQSTLTRESKEDENPSRVKSFHNILEGSFIHLDFAKNTL